MTDEEAIAALRIAQDAVRVAELEVGPRMLSRLNDAITRGDVDGVERVLRTRLTPWLNASLSDVAFQAGFARAYP
jgi:hypothetical protein